MQKIYTAQTLLMVTHIKNLLASAHIQSEIRNEYAAGGVGELSFLDTWPELWVSYDDVALATNVIANNQDLNTEEDWICACGEGNGATFGSCWSCGVSRAV
jgi:hypothetical protein